MFFMPVNCFWPNFVRIFLCSRGIKIRGGWVLIFSLTLSTKLKTRKRQWYLQMSVSQQMHCLSLGVTYFRPKTRYTKIFLICKWVSFPEINIISTLVIVRKGYSFSKLDMYSFFHQLSQNTTKGCSPESSNCTQIFGDSNSRLGHSGARLAGSGAFLGSQ
jgi:hypothetical protein